MLVHRLRWWPALKHPLVAASSMTLAAESRWVDVGPMLAPRHVLTAGYILLT